MNFRNYELMYIVRPDLDGEDTTGLINGYQELLEDLGGEITGTDDWGMRRLAYEIDDHIEGYYVITRFMGDRVIIDEMERRMKLDGDVVRHMVVRDED